MSFAGDLDASGDDSTLSCPEGEPAPGKGFYARARLKEQLDHGDYAERRGVFQEWLRAGAHLRDLGSWMARRLSGLQGSRATTLAGPLSAAHDKRGAVLARGR